MAALLKKRALAEYSQTFRDPSHLPSKKLHLAKKPLIGSSAAAFVGLLEKCKTSNDALQLLLRISDSLQFQESDIDDAIKKLSEHYQAEEESAVRVKILSLFADIGLECPGANVVALIDETVHLLNVKNESSHKALPVIRRSAQSIGKRRTILKPPSIAPRCSPRWSNQSYLSTTQSWQVLQSSFQVIAQGIATLMKLGHKQNYDSTLHGKLINLAKEYLKDTSHQVKCRCLQLISEMYPLTADMESNENTQTDTETVLKLFGDYTYSQDARVRCEAFAGMWTLHHRGLPLSASLYSQVCVALVDDYEIVREAAIKLVWLLGNKYPENLITLPDGETTIRLVDDAFVKLCNAVNDLSMNVRAMACTLLGTTKLVSSKFLQQTLDKQLMSNMKKKVSAHERAAIAAGVANPPIPEFASGRRWAEGVPTSSSSHADSVSLMGGGAAGAFVHGLEDEFMEVRTAAVEAVCLLSLDNETFATTSLDFLVDMFNDEIEDVRLKAIDSLTKISHHIVLREDQLETILGALEDFSMDVREGLHQMLGSCKLASKTCLEMCIDKILENLKKYPHDKRSTYRCMQRIGAAHPELTLPLVPRLLIIHPFFDMPQPDFDDPSYICVLILVFNAAQHCSSTLQLFEDHTIKHYSYLRDTMSHLVPQLPIGDTKTSPTSGLQQGSALYGSLNDAELGDDGIKSESGDRAIQRFFDTIMSHIDNPSVSNRVRMELLKSAEEQLNKLTEMEPSISGAANYTSLFARTVLSLSRIVSALGTAGVTSGIGASHYALEQLRTNCLRLQQQFSGVSFCEECCSRQLALRCSAARLVAAAALPSSPAQATTPNASAATAQPIAALALAFLAETEAADRYLADCNVEPDQFTISVFQQLSILGDPKPLSLARVLLPLLQAAHPPKIPRPNTNIRMCTATILEPRSSADTVLRFAAGLVSVVSLEAEVLNVTSPESLRVRVRYPDTRAHLVVPRREHIRPLDHPEARNDDLNGSNLRLLTKVLISHQVWTEPCAVEISLCLAVPDETVASGRKEAGVIELCKPAKVTVAPKPIKRGI